MDKKKIAFIVAGAAVVLFALMLIIQKDVFKAGDQMSDPAEPGQTLQPMPDDGLPEMTEGDTTADIEADLEGIDLEELDSEYQDVDADLNNL